MSEKYDVAHKLSCFLVVYIAVSRGLSQYSVSGGLWLSEQAGMD
jgi:hypothetical protein